VAEEKDRIHENSMNSLKELQNEYEEQRSSLYGEFKAKEEKMRRKFEQLEETTMNRYKEKENDLTEKLEKMSDDYNSLMHTFDSLEKERDSLKETVIKHDKVLRIKEDEYEQALLAKDSRMKELELYIRSISEEANLQIAKLSNSVTDFNDKINFYKNREFDLSQEVVKLQKHAEHSELLDLNKSRDIMHSAEVRMTKLIEENKHLSRAVEELKAKVISQENDLNVYR
jgi:chromosome segregation ATPase